MVHDRDTEAAEHLAVLMAARRAYDEALLDLTTNLRHAGGVLRLHEVSDMRDSRWGVVGGEVGWGEFDEEWTYAEEIRERVDRGHLVFFLVSPEMRVGNVPEWMVFDARRQEEH